MNPAVRRWVDEIKALTTPSAVVYCDGSKAERDRLIAECLESGELIELNQQKLPGCYLHRSAAHDVARTEHLTFVSTAVEEDAGPTNNWMSPATAREKLIPLFTESMKGRTMFVVPFLMGPPGSPYSKVGVEITDSRYVVLNMRIMTRIGQVALDHLGQSDDFTRCLHSLGDLSPDRRFIVHFPGRERGVVDRIGIRWQRAARKEVSRAPSRQLSGAQRRMARRAHVDRWLPLRGRPGPIHCGRISFGLRQDQHGDARAARVNAWLADVDGR